jgi:hypothetical protein
MLLLLRRLLRYAGTFCAFEQIREPTTTVKRRLEQLPFCEMKELVYEKFASQIETKKGY